jgi:hypothetical protein
MRTAVERVRFLFCFLVNNCCIFVFSAKNSTPGCSTSRSGGFYANYEVHDIVGRFVCLCVCVCFTFVLFNNFTFSSGMASTVRRCCQKSTGQMFAVKIIDITTEKQSAVDVERLMAETRDEILILRELQGHSSISMCVLFSFQSA